jgi:hypothetical protein
MISFKISLRNTLALLELAGISHLALVKCTFMPEDYFISPDIGAGHLAFGLDYQLLL